MVGFGSIAKKIFGSSNDRKVKRYQKQVDAINAMEQGPRYAQIGKKIKQVIDL